MKKIVNTLTLACMGVAAAYAGPDRVGGSPKADFHANELTIPCVLVEGLDESTDGMFFDVVLSRRGSSYNYELTAAEAEDTEQCQRIADFAEYEDDDYSEDGEDDSAGPDILLQCEVFADRSRISVNGKHLEAGDYIVSVSSGENSADSLPVSTSEDEVEVDFDSNPNDISAGAVSIAPDFITGAEVSATITPDGDTEALLMTTAGCADNSAS